MADNDYHYILKLHCRSTLHRDIPPATKLAPPCDEHNRSYYVETDHNIDRLHNTHHHLPHLHNTHYYVVESIANSEMCGSMGTVRRNRLDWPDVLPSVVHLHARG